MSGSFGAQRCLIWTPAKSPCPFLFNTWTIQHSRLRISSTPYEQTSKSFSRTHISREDDTQRPFDLPNFLRQKAKSLNKVNRNTKPRSSITNAERDAFKEVMKLFETDGAKATSADNRDVNYQNILDIFAPTESHKYEPRVNRTASAIMQEISESFDTALRSQNLAPDIALWRACEENVFPLVSLLKDQPIRHSEPESDSHKENGSSPELEFNITVNATVSSGNAKAQLPFNIASLIPFSTSSLALLTQLYPAALLLSLRLFLVHQPTSPFALALLPRIRQLGAISYVLGANTHFYNALISLQWDIYSDLKSIDLLLGEMQRGGVEMDTSTFAVIKRIKWDRRRDLERETGTTEAGARPKEWWQTRERKTWFKRVGVEWKNLIAKDLGARGDAVIAEDLGEAYADSRHGRSSEHTTGWGLIDEDVPNNVRL